MKKIWTITALLCMCFLLIGCAKRINTEYREVDVIIVDEYHRSAYPYTSKVGKTTMVRVSPAVYNITVEYNEKKYTLSGSDIYNKYKDKIGQTVKGTLEVRAYDDNSIRYSIIAIE